MLSSAPSQAAATPTQAVFERIVRKRGRACSRCGGRHRDPVYKYCGPCRDLTAAYHMAYRRDHIARKLCPECVQKKGKVTINCEFHRKYHNDLLARRYYEKRESGLCVIGACPNPSEGILCDEHKARAQAAAALRRGRPWRKSA